MSRRCFARNCCVLEEGDHLYNSPRDPEIYRHWAEFVGRRPYAKEQLRIRLCQRHFESKYFSFLNGKPVLRGSDVRPTIQIQGPETELDHHGSVFAESYAELNILSWLPERDLRKFMVFMGFMDDPAVSKTSLPTDPSPSTLTSVLSTSEHSPPPYSLEPGINQFLFDSVANCMRTFVKKRDHENCFCSLMFEEMVIGENLRYDPRSDRLLGFEDLGATCGGVTDSLARKALVFMLSGLADSWKQPVAFYFTRNGVSAETLVRLLREVMGACDDAGLMIACTVCNITKRNVRAMRMMGASPHHPYFKFNSRRIVSLYDVPHLLKYTRDLLYRDEIYVPVKDVRGTVSWEATSWEHVRLTYQTDRERGAQLLGKVTPGHLDPEGRDAAKTSMAVHVLSGSMAAAMCSFLEEDILPTAAGATAKVCRDMNELFDSMNGGIQNEPNNDWYLRNKTQEVHLKFWTSALDELETWSFYRTNKEMAEEEEFIPPSHRGWLQTILGVTRLWKNLNKYYVDGLQLRRLNLDPVENLFELIRHICGYVGNPTVTQFMSGLKTSLLNVKRDFKCVNCEDDCSRLLLDNMKEFLGETPGRIYMSHEDMLADLKLDVMSNSLASITGYIGRKILANGDCDRCKAMIATDSSEDLDLVGIGFKRSKDRPDFLYPTDNFVELVGSVVTVAERVLGEVAHLGGIKRSIVEASKREINLDWVKDGCSEHHMSVSDSIVDTCATMAIKWWARRVNSKMV